MQYVKPITSDDDLLNLSKIINVKIDKVYDMLEVDKPLPNKGSFLILIRSSEGIGHWVCMIDDHYFDPYGLQAPDILDVETFYSKQVQGVDLDFCGIYVLLYLYCVQNNLNDLFEYSFYDLNIEV